MRSRMWKILRIGLIVPAIGLVGSSSQGEEPSRLGRWFRFGSGGNPGHQAPPAPPRPLDAPVSPQPLPPSPAPPSAFPDPSLSVPTGPPPGGAAPRIVPQPRVGRAVTDADPILTRVALARADNGTQFGLFLQVYADGTIIDSEGVHRLGPDALKPLLQTIQSGELARARGYCGGPPTDFNEQFLVIVYDRSLGRLRASSFAYSGNPQGCDHAIRHLHAAIEGLQMKLSGPPVPMPDVTTAASPSPTPEIPSPNPAPIPLSPLNP